MAKKRTELEEPEELVEQVEPEKPEEKAAPVEDLPYELHKWKEFTQWQCKLCPYDTLEGESVFWLHYATVHAPVVPAPVIQIYNVFDNPVK